MSIIKLPSKWIAIDGIDGCGKTTSINYIKDYLESLGHKIFISKAIGGGVNGELFRKLLLESKLDTNTTNLLVTACHTNCFQEILEYLNDGYSVIQDRSIASYYAYNYQTPFTSNYLKANNEAGLLFNGFLINNKIITRRPDMSIFINIDVDIAKQRMLSRNSNLVYTDNGSKEYFTKLISSFIEYYEMFITSNELSVINNDDELNKLYSSLKKIVDRLYSTYRETNTL